MNFNIKEGDLLFIGGPKHMEWWGLSCMPERIVVPVYEKVKGIKPVTVREVERLIYLHMTWSYKGYEHHYYLLESEPIPEKSYLITIFFDRHLKCGGWR